MLSAAEIPKPQKRKMKDKRLLCCAELCVGGRAVDVGTDHGHLAVYLVEQGICKSCIACDINEKPLAAARSSIRAAGLEDRIEAVLSDGLDSIDPEGVTDVVIAGMGGELIAEIIQRAEWLKENRVNLVLQPMTKWDHLRRELYENGFDVRRELACTEGKFVYSVMQAVYTGEKPGYPCDLRYLYGGIVEPDSEASSAYLLRQASRLEAAAGGMIKDPQRTKQGSAYFAAARELRDLAAGFDINS